ncbi:MAG: hypothetical protein V1929_01105 [bacterium]
MKIIPASIGVGLLFVLVTHLNAQEPSPSLYDKMMKTLAPETRARNFYPFLQSLSKGEFKQLVIEYRQRNEPSPQVDVYGGMNMLAGPYYQSGAGKNDTYEDWAKDVRDHSFPVEWRNIILGHPPSAARPVSGAQQKDYQDMFFSIFSSRDEDIGLRREALLALSRVVRYESLSADQLGEYLALLKEIVMTPDQHRGFFQTALREIDHVIDSGKEAAARGSAPAIAKAIAAGDTAAVEGDKNLPAEQKQFFTQVAGLSKDFGAILENLSSTTNLSNYLQHEARKMKDKLISVPATH